MAAKDFIINFFGDSPQLEAALKSLQSDYLVFTPNVSNRQYKEFVSGAGGTVQGIWDKARAASDTLNRVALIGFSEGCQGVSAVLDCPDASAIDVVIPVDGIHRQFTDPIIHAINPVALKNYIAFAQMASATPPSVNPNGKLMVITHSSIGAASLPAGLASTTQTAEVIWSEALRLSAPPTIETSACGWPCPAAIHESNLASVLWPNATYPLGTKLAGATITDQGYTTVRPTAPESGNLPPATFSWSGFGDGWVLRRIANNLYIFGWSYDTPNHTKDPTGNRDHVFQAQMVLPAVASEFLVKRWNPNCDSIHGFGDVGAAICSPGSGQGYSQQKAAPLPNPYPIGIALPVLPDKCYPAPGQTVVGRPGDPCWVGYDAPGEPIDFGPAGKILLGASAGIAAYYGTRFFMKKARGRSR